MHHTPNTANTAKLDINTHKAQPTQQNQPRHLSQTTDKMYIDHMIPHHQVAIDMCKLILKNTRNDFIMSLAYEMLKTQEAEVVLLNNLRRSVCIPNQLEWY